MKRGRKRTTSYTVYEKKSSHRSPKKPAPLKSSNRTQKGLKKYSSSSSILTRIDTWLTQRWVILLAAIASFFTTPKRGRGRPRKIITLKEHLIQYRTKVRRFKRNLYHEIYDVLFQPNGEIFIVPQLPKPKPAIKKATPLQTPSFFASLKFQIAVSLIMTLSITLTAYWVYVTLFFNLPSATALTEKQQDVTTRITDRNGRILYRVYEDENRTLVPLSQVPQHVINATIAIEDKEFYDHPGFSVTGITRAFLANLKGESVQGGSTITQQLVKNRLLSPERTMQRKLRELILSILVDSTYTKEEILEMYLNQVSYGGSAYGIEEAAQQYFGKSAKQLSLAEGTLLAGLPAAPSAYSPFGAIPEYAKIRQQEVLRRMVEDGFITQAQADEALATQLSYRENVVDIRAPHFVMYVKQLLAEQYGEQLVSRGGLEVTTTLDLDLQTSTQEIVTTEVDKLKNYRISNGAAVITNPQTGEILSMIGSKNYFDFAHDGQVNVAVRPRQPGSSIKPLTYALALENGRTPLTLIEDTPITYVTKGSPPYSPKNYDGKYHGKVTLRQALASSYNIPAVKLLAEIGLQRFIDKGIAMGISTWYDRSRYGLSLTLGGGEVLMTDMAELYGTFANYGYTVNLNPILEVKDAHGKVLYRNTCALDNTGCPRRKTLDHRVAYQVTNILSDNTARTPAFGPQSVLHIPNQQVAVKTGTTNSMRDNWTIGYTSDYLVAVWVGNNDNTPMSYVASGITGASPIWNKIIRQTLDPENPHQFVAAEGLLKVAVCKTSGTVPCASCSQTVEEYFLPGTEPKNHCTTAEASLTQPGGNKPLQTPAASPITRARQNRVPL